MLIVLAATRDMRAMDVGVASGAGLRLGRGSYQWTAEARYGTSFGDLYKFRGNVDSINQAFVFTVAVSR